MKESKKNLPPLLKEGFDLYLSKGTIAAVACWARGSAQNDSPILEEKIKALQDVEDLCGDFLGYEVKDTQIITSMAHLFFIVLKYEQINVNSRFLAYKQNKGWVLANFLFDVSLETSKAFLV
ncbi:hypothetical protein AB834_05500 [PVC group bacterium (ex Bugula neritina AB1)]|nr:hypothetical protein AB834_05500 [PVC group bacterium (ex Bugula neritina AB1)]